MDGEGHFKTAMTTVAPNRKGQWICVHTFSGSETFSLGGDVLHPSVRHFQRRGSCLLSNY